MSDTFHHPLTIHKPDVAHGMTNQPPLRVALIGLGHRERKRGLQDIMKHKAYNIVAICDTDVDAIAEASSWAPMAGQYHSVDSLLQAHQCPTEDLQLDCVYVAVPHCTYAEIVSRMLSHAIHVLREKPAGMNFKEVHQLQENATSRATTTILLTAAQRRYGVQWQTLAEQLPQIGPIRAIEGTRTVSVVRLDQSWRASKASAGGGVVRDLGWHLIDLVLGLLGTDYVASVSHARMIITKDDRSYDCEDLAYICLDMIPTVVTANATSSIPCNLRMSRSALSNTDELTFFGTNGVLSMNGDEITFAKRQGEDIVTSRERLDTASDFVRMLSFFAEATRDVKKCSKYDTFAMLDLKVTRLIDELYTESKTSPNHTLEAKTSRLNPKTTWPKITNDVIESVVDQVKKTISIYGNHGVFGEFERKFSRSLNMSDANTLLHNSGTNALLALFYAIGLQPRDEVIFPVYTFHATCSPAMTLGVTPVFCDSGADGNIDPDALRNLLCDRTKAVVVTHMWGMPCKMASITEILREFPNVRLLEDCSHAHGARIGGQCVGTFGDGAAWSLQGQKIISGGEGGVTVTKHKKLHYKMLLLGHYNKRCKLEIPERDDLRKFALTGAGMKNRAHPLAVRIALNQLEKLPQFRSWKSHHAQRLATAINTVPFLQAPDMDYLHQAGVEPSWYALTMLFNEQRAPAGLTRNLFVDLLKNQGLGDIDIPSSTGLLHKQPLFVSPADILPHMYEQHGYCNRNEGRSFPKALAFWTTVIKIPVWAHETDSSMVDDYIKAILFVSTNYKKLTAKL